MAGARAAVGLLLGSAPVAASGLLRTHAATHPVEDTIHMLQRLGVQVEEEGKAEALTYQKFEYWCGNSKKTLEKAIAGEKKAIVVLQEEIDGHNKNIEVLGSEMDALNAEIGEHVKAETAATARRTAGANLYTAESGAHTDTITAIDNAIQALITAKDGSAQFLQSRVQGIVEMAAARGVSVPPALLQQFSENATRPDLAAEGDYAEHVQRYSFKSTSVVELLKELKARFEEEKLALDKAETNAINADALAKDARNKLVAAAGQALGIKSLAKTAAEGDLGRATTDLGDTQGDLDADTGALKTTTNACQVKATEWAERSKVRADEKAALEAAISILAKVAGVRTDAPENPVPPASPVAFLQVEGANPEVKQALKLLRKEASVTHSRAIADLAEAVARSEEGPFDQVVNSIQKLIQHLMNEQTEEDNHKAWCDKEVEKTDNAISDKNDKIGELTTKINEAQGRMQTLTQDIATASQKVTELEAHMEEATEIRNIGKEENHLAVKDAEAAQKAMTEALAVIKEFYQSTGSVPKQSWEFVQRLSEPVVLGSEPTTWANSYQGVADPSHQPDGILSILQSIMADFANMESRTLAQEESDQHAYEEDMKACKIEKARRAKEAEMKTQEKGRLVESTASLEASRKSVNKEKDATDQYKTDLNKACVDGSSTFDERKAARADEIQALQQAQGFLQDAFKNVTTF